MTIKKQQNGILITYSKEEFEKKLSDDIKTFEKYNSIMNNLFESDDENDSDLAEEMYSNIDSEMKFGIYLFLDDIQKEFPSKEGFRLDVSKIKANQAFIYEVEIHDLSLLKIRYEDLYTESYIRKQYSWINLDLGFSLDENLDGYSIFVGNDVYKKDI